MTDSATPKAAPVSLASLLTPSKTVNIDFPGYKGFSLDICYLGRDELLKLRKKCVSTKFNKRTHQPEETLDDSWITDTVSNLENFTGGK
jgi:hypothetical protein